MKLLLIMEEIAVSETVPLLFIIIVIEAHLPVTYGANLILLLLAGRCFCVSCCRVGEIGQIGSRH